MPRVTERTTDQAWAPGIVAVAESIAPTQRCNASAVAHGDLGLSVPTLNAVQDFLRRPDCVVAICHDGAELQAYLIVVDDRAGKHGGGQGRWVGMDNQTIPAAQRAGVYMALLDVAAGEYGWVWGRITNVDVRAMLDDGIPDGAIAPEDPEIITYKRP